MSNREMNSSYSETPVTHFQADDVSPPTLTLPPLLLQQGPVPSPSPPKPLTQCPLCSLKHNKFHCGVCVGRGDFAHSSSALCETLAEKQRRLIALHRDIRDTKEEISALATAKWSSGLLREDIKVTRTRLKYLRHVIKQQKEKQLESLEKLSSRAESNRKREERLPQFREKAEKMRDFVRNFSVERTELSDRAHLSQLDLSKTRAEWILSCHDLIFPVLTLETDQIQTEADESELMIMESLADAIQTSYISGRWVRSDYREGGHSQLRLVTGEEHSQHSQHSQHQGAATLCLAGQLTSLISGVLQAPLPVRLHWAELGVVETSESRLARKAARLNLNVARLCLECGVEPGDIKPAQCLHNLHRMVESLRLHNTARLETGTSSGEQLDILQAQLEDYEEESASEEESEQWESVTGDQVPSVQSQSSLATAVTNTVSQILWGPP